MAIGPGTRVGPYEITALVGEGGMGKVWRAHHTALKRDDALKVLPDAFASDPERLARFRREAQVLASLNHPNIAHVHGLEQADGVQALVMELVEGPTLADRIAQGPIPVDEALPIAKQIAEALEAAHEQGIIHRDLKPANIKVRDDGTVKVLDFGLAKALEPAGASRTDATASPTITSPALMTGVGVLLGTAAYMSPEQAKGRAADKRSDIWAFGCVLYEMLTAKRCFDGEDMTEVLGAVVRLDPNWDALPEGVPSTVRSLLRRCLEKDRRKRVGDIAAALFVIDDARTPEPLERPAPPAAASWQRFLPYAAVVVATTTIAGAVGWLLARPTPPPGERLRFTVDLPPIVQFGNARHRLAISSDGRRIAYSGLGRGITQLYVRSLDRLDSIAIRETEGGLTGIFLSPDGEWVGYNDTNTFKKVPVGGGPSATICQVPAEGGGVRGATWGTGGRIVFATVAARGLMQVSDAGGTPAPLTSPPEGELHRDPHFLPDGRHVLFVIEHTGQPDRIAVVSLDTAEPRVLLEGNHPKFASSGHLVFLREGALWATAFDAARLTVTGNPLPVLDGIDASPDIATYDLAGNGSLVYSQDTGPALRTLMWVDRQSMEEMIPAPPRAYWSARISPDGSRIALDIRDQQNDIWVWDLRSRTLTRTTFHGAQDEAPVWAPDGRRIAFRSNRGGQFELFWRPADGTGTEEQLTQSVNAATPTAFSPEGTHLVLHHTESSGTSDVMALDVAGSRKTTPLVQSPFAEFYADVSPDGRWLVYQSQESGTNQIVVSPFPDVGAGRWQVGGGRHPVWSRSGRELFYVGPDERLMSAAIDTVSGFRSDTPRTILAQSFFEPIGVRAYDVSPDGRRFLMIKPVSGPEGARAQIVVVTNWQEELKRLVPTN